jgi:hypothetical protein
MTDNFKIQRLCDLEVGKYYINKVTHTTEWKIFTKCGLELQATDNLVKSMLRHNLFEYELVITHSCKGHVEYYICF